MLKVREAQFRRVLDRLGQTYAEVEVFTDHNRNPQMLAYFRMGPDRSFLLVKVFSNNADQEIDWFENNLHSVFEDMTTQLFATPDHLAENDRGDFTAQILSYDGIIQALNRNLKP
jgi:hypothetical protein